MGQQATIFGEGQPQTVMTNTAKLLRLAELVSTMRVFQKAYFQAPHGSTSKAQLLKDSKNAEVEVDKFLKQI